VIPLVLAWLAAPDVAQQPIAVAGVPVVPVMPADVAAPDVAAVLVAAGAAVVLAVQASWAWPGVPGAPGAPVALAALPVVLAALTDVAVPVEEAIGGLAWVVEPAGQCVPLAPAFLLEWGAMVREWAVDAAGQPAAGLVHDARREEAGS
jgi:hypothetical protein